LLKIFWGLIEKKVEPNDCVMEGVTMGPIDTEDLRATGSFREIGNVVLGKLLTQVEADHIEFSYITNVPLVGLSRYVSFNEAS
jgi:hypothetical protein